MLSITKEKKESLSDLFNEAVLIASQVPEHFQQAAFLKALDYLTNPEFSQSPAISSSTKRTKATSKIRATSDPAKTQKKRGRPGPKAAVAELAATDFLSTRKTVPEIQQFLKNRRGHEYGQNELSISVVRLVRDGVLDREQNDAGQYAYIAVSRSVS